MRMLRQWNAPSAWSSRGSVVLMVGVLAATSTPACGGDAGAPSGSGGVTSVGSGGAPASGGGSGRGGATATGGQASTGGQPGSSGGASSSGGAGTGGRAGSGGATASGGRAGNGGTTGTGATAGGGRSGSGGAAASGGAGGRGGSAVAGTGGMTGGGGATGGGAVIAGCSLLPATHLFNTPIDSLPVDPQSAKYLTSIGDHNLHLDLGSSTDITMVDSYYGIPYNVVHGTSASWVPVRFSSADPDLDWDARGEADCVDAASGSAHTKVSPCTSAAAPNPVFPIPAQPLVEGGIDSDPKQPYGDHHILLLDADTCLLHELYHAYPRAGGGAGWDIYGSAVFDLRSNALRKDGWTSADAAGFPILPLLLRADEASSGQIRHALRFTITSSKIRNSAVWPARHHTGNGTTSTNQPPMGQLFRLKASYAIPSSFNTQARAIAQAMKTYGLYIADGGSDMYVTGEPSAAWADATISQVQTISSGQFEAVDLMPVHQRAGFDIDSAAVPPP